MGFQARTFTSPQKHVRLVPPLFACFHRDLTPFPARYPTGFGTSLAVLGFGNIIVPGLYWWYCGRINKKRDQMSKEEIDSRYTDEELAQLGDLSPLYRYER